MQREFSITIADSAFLETGGVFRATLTNISLIGGGELSSRMCTDGILLSVNFIHCSYTPNPFNGVTKYWPAG